MASASYHRWATVRAATLNDVESAHAALGGTGRGVRLAGRQVIRAYAVLLAAEFQGYCRELHDECVEALTRSIPLPLQGIVRKQFLFNRSLSRGNATPANLGADFGRFGLNFWDQLNNLDSRVSDWRKALDQLNDWRNAIAHNDYDPTRLGSTMSLHVRRVREWRMACTKLARTSDRVMAAYLKSVTGVASW